MTVPKQTFHALRSLSYQNSKICIISFNPLGSFAIKVTGLLKYIDTFICDPNVDRPIKKKLFDLLKEEEFSTIYYYDDCLDNVMAVQRSYPFIKIYHITNPQQLFQTIKKKSDLELKKIIG